MRVVSVTMKASVFHWLVILVFTPPWFSLLANTAESKAEHSLEKALPLHASYLSLLDFSFDHL